MDDAELVLGDRVGRTNFGADGILAVHANLDAGLHGGGPVHVVHMDHRSLAVGLAFRAGHLTGVAADAALGINEEFFVLFELRVDHFLG